jgi:hypothetical protein
MWRDLISKISGLCGIREKACGRWRLEIRRTRKMIFEVEEQKIQAIIRVLVSYSPFPSLHLVITILKVGSDLKRRDRCIRHLARACSLNKGGASSVVLIVF